MTIWWKLLSECQRYQCKGKESVGNKMDLVSRRTSVLTTRILFVISFKYQPI
jgi:hypothetical protein